MISRNTFKKNERLKSRKKTDELFNSGSSFHLHSFKIIFLVNDDTSLKSGVQILISAPKKRIPLSVDRNKIKRKMRESYRTQKHSLINFCTEKNISLTLGFVFSGEKEISFSEIKTAMSKALQKTEEKIQTEKK